MLKELITYLFDFVKGADKIVEVDKRKYFTFGRDFEIINPPLPTALSVQGLAGVVGYIKSEPADTKLVVTCDTSTVQVRGSLDELYQDRACYLATSFGYFTFKFGYYYGVEEFIILMQSQFEETPEKTTLLKLIGNIKDGQVISRLDDGITQEVTARVGITRLENVPLQNPVKLNPKRTFSEVEQVESPFIIRGRSGQGEPSFALFEADGGAWQIEAVKRIKEYIFKEAGALNSNLLIL